MNPSIRWLALGCLLLAGCVSSDGTKPLKQEDPKLATAKANVQLGTAYLQQGNYNVAKEKLERSLSRALIYHPLPRQDEIDPDCDDLPNAMYFEQVRLSKFMRMAILRRMLSIS